MIYYEFGMRGYQKSACHNVLVVIRVVNEQYQLRAATDTIPQSTSLFRHERPGMGKLLLIRRPLKGAGSCAPSATGFFVPLTYTLMQSHLISAES